MCIGRFATHVHRSEDAWSRHRERKLRPMKIFFRNHPMISMCIAMLVAAIATQWILNPKSGPFSALTLANSLTIGAVLLIIVGGIALTYVAMRLGSDPSGFGLVPLG